MIDSLQRYPNTFRISQPSIFDAKSFTFLCSSATATHGLPRGHRLPTCFLPFNDTSISHILLTIICSVLSKLLRFSALIAQVSASLVMPRKFPHRSQQLPQVSTPSNPSYTFNIPRTVTRVHGGPILYV